MLHYSCLVVKPLYNSKCSSVRQLILHLGGHVIFIAAVKHRRLIICEEIYIAALRTDKINLVLIELNTVLSFSRDRKG